MHEREQFTIAFSEQPPLSLYVHLPWCVRKCPYCDFNSHEYNGVLPEQAYVNALIEDLEHDLPSVWGRPVTSIFIGGGTPSLFSVESINQLLCAIRARLKLVPGAEITLEANPGASELQKFEEFRAAGVNRLSIGVQSFNDDLLRSLGRIHGRREAIKAAEAAHQAGFDNFNLDLMFALPDQRQAQAQTDISTAIALEPPHISLYQLTIEPNTLFHHSPPELPDDDLAWRMQEDGQMLLAERGYAQYEVSAYAKAGAQCRHNLHYWQFGDYLGIGAGAHGKLSKPDSITRQWKLKQPREYMDKHGAERCGGESQLSSAEVVLEFMINALRLNEGFPTRLFTQRTGLPLASAQLGLSLGEERGWLEYNAEFIRPTAAGRQFLNDLLQLFMADEKKRHASEATTGHLPDGVATASQQRQKQRQQ